MQHRGRRDAHLGRPRGDALEKVEVAALDAAACGGPARSTRMVGGRKPTSVPSSRRNVAVKLPSPTSTPSSCSRKSTWKKVRRNSPSVMPAQADLLLAAHHVPDRRVLDRAQRRGIDLAAGVPRARLEQALAAAESCRRDRRDRVAWCGPRLASRRMRAPARLRDAARSRSTIAMIGARDKPGLHSDGAQVPARLSVPMPLRTTDPGLRAPAGGWRPVPVHL